MQRNGQNNNKEKLEHKEDQDNEENYLTNGENEENEYKNKEDESSQSREVGVGNPTSIRDKDIS